MKKVIFMVINMNIGGTEKALLNMISEMPKNDYAITILMLERYGGFLESIPDHVKIKILDNYQEIKPILNEPPQYTVLKLIKQGRLLRGFNIFIVHIISKIKKERSYFLKYILKDFLVLEEQYDLAIAYAGPMDFITYFVVKKIKAKKKIQWIHFDVSKIGFNKYFAEKWYKEFDKIFIVSKEGRKKLLEYIPNLKSKIEVFSNIVSYELINKQADEGSGFTDKFDGIRILTVGRLTQEKGQDLCIEALAKLKNDGFKVRWYCVGDGVSKEKYINLIKYYNLEENFILLGATTNPYSYMKQCDIYVQPSRYEGYCITLAEAKCFNKTIITTNFTGANEQIINYKNGIIVDCESDDIYISIKKILSNHQFKFSLINKLKDKK